MPLHLPRLLWVAILKDQPLAKRWSLRPADEAQVLALKQSLGLPRLLARTLAARGIAVSGRADDFLSPQLSQTHSPWQLSGMQAGVERTLTALRLGHPIVVFGDYDVDGVTSTALLIKVLRLLGAEPRYYIPDRLSEGYGPNSAAFAKLKSEGARLIITVDCGINAVTEGLAAQELGLDLIVTDHHVPGPELPTAIAVINPKTSPDYPYSMLGGVGVAYKFAQALLEAAKEPRATEFLDNMLELVALGTVCDVAPLDGENRALVAEGLKRLRLGRWLGLRELSKVGGLDPARTDAGHLGFVLGPRLNAGGRVSQASLGVRLLLSKDMSETRALANELNDLNQRRQSLERDTIEEAIPMAEACLKRGDRAIVVWKEGWHAGVIGLVASRLKDRLGRPTVALAVDHGMAKGSGRSQKPLNLVEALRDCEKLLLRFGGHEYAAGMTLEADKLEAFRQALNEATIKRVPLEQADPELEIDAEASFDEINGALVDRLSDFEPFGAKNPRPIFSSGPCRVMPGSRPVGAKGEHVRLLLNQNGKTLPAIAFRMGERFCEAEPGATLQVAFSPQWNEFQGEKNLQLEIRDWIPKGNT